MSDSPETLRHTIHSSFESGKFADASFDTDVNNLNTASRYSTGVASNLPMYTLLIQELNRKYDAFGHSANIRGEIDSGFRPLNVLDFFRDTDPILLENGSNLLGEASFKLLQEQF